MAGATAPMPMNLALDHLSKAYAGQPVLRGLSSRVSGVRALAVVGPSGGGKSTLLRILAGLERPSGGSVAVNGRPLGGTEAELRAYRRRLGIVFQAYNLFPHLSARENVALPLREVHGLTRFDAGEAANRWLGRFGLEVHGDKKPGELSGGQSQRVAIARAMASGPEILVLDEPTSALDPEMTAEVLEAVVEVRETGTEVLLVTHEVGFAREVSDHTWFLADGQLLEDGPTRAVFGTPRSEAFTAFRDKVARFHL